MSSSTTELENYCGATRQIVHDVFETMLSTETWSENAHPPSDAPERPLVGAIYFAGSWKGALLMEFSPGQAMALASKLTSVDLPAEVNEDVRDAVGEICNMVAGNLKSLLPPGTGLSLPSVVEGRDYTLRILGGRESLGLPFGSPIGSFLITLVHTEEA